MPYKSGVFQAALGAISAVAFIISNSFGSGSPNEKRVVGTIERTGGQNFQITDSRSKHHEFQTSEPVRIFLNENQIAFDQIENGRTAAVRYVKKDHICFATSIEIFPTHRDIGL